jgi:hypothetical protein
LNYFLSQGDFIALGRIRIRDPDPEPDPGFFQRSDPDPDPDKMDRIRQLCFSAHPGPIKRYGFDRIRIRNTDMYCTIAVPIEYKTEAHTLQND